MNVVVQVVLRAHPELANVPVAGQFARSDEARQLLKIGIQDLGALGHSYTFPPKTRKNHVDTLRKSISKRKRTQSCTAKSS